MRVRNVLICLIYFILWVTINFQLYDQFTIDSDQDFLVIHHDLLFRIKLLALISKIQAVQKTSSH